MTKLKREELLKEIKEIFDHYLGDLRDYPSEVIVKQTYQQIKELIQKPQVTEEWIGEKVTELFRWQAETRLPHECKDFIRSLIEEMGA